MTGAFDIKIRKKLNGGSMEKIGLIGLGNMGEAILKALINSGYRSEDLFFSEIKPERAEFIAKTYKVKHIKDIKQILNKVKYIIIAVKPQDAQKTLSGIIPFINEENIVISIMAGISISKILSFSSKEFKVVRAMPNICAKVGQSVTAIIANKEVENDELKEVKKILSSIGHVVEIDEGQMDAMTALSGSGPAFVLLFLEAMIDAGVKMGLLREKTKEIMVNVLKGTVEMLEKENLHPTLLKEMVTSPGGTTIYGLTYLEEKAFKGNLIKAIEKAAKRAGELST